MAGTSAPLYFRLVRGLPLLLLAIVVNGAVAQRSLVLNELLPSNRGTYANHVAPTPDWIEAFNTTGEEIDLRGWRIAMNGRQHVFMESLAVPARSHLILWCDGRTDEGADHLAFKLSRHGGAVLLIEPDGITIGDIFSYPAMPQNVSIGRLPDGSKEWSFFSDPTPGTTNQAPGSPIHSRCPRPMASAGSGYYSEAVRIEFESVPGCRIRYTLDGSDPNGVTALDYDGSIHASSSLTIRAEAVGAAHLPSEEFVGTYVIGGFRPEAIGLTMAPDDLWSDSIGIYTSGLFNNNTRKGQEWVRDGLVERLGDGPIAVRASLHGSGSRGLRKRSFKLTAQDGTPFRFSDGTAVDEVILRADAGPHAWLRNATMESLVRKHALHVEVQPSQSLPLYLNAAYWGMYRWMPAKDAAWLRQRCDAEAVDVLEGPAARVVSGHGGHYRQAMDLLMTGAAFDSIDAMIDTRSLIDLACIDLWTGRADHELNMRCFRPRRPGGRWRWVLFDMDLWSTPEENSVERMCSAAAPETPFITQLLAHAELRSRLLARLTAMQAAVLGETATVADSLQRAHSDELLANHKRWELELESPRPDSSLALLRRFVEQRPMHLFEHIARRAGTKARTTIIEVPPADVATIMLDGLRLPEGRQVVRCFSGITVPLTVLPGPGQQFVSWKGLSLETTTGEVDLSRAKVIRPTLRPVVP